MANKLELWQINEHIKNFSVHAQHEDVFISKTSPLTYTIALIWFDSIQTEQGVQHKVLEILKKQFPDETFILKTKKGRGFNKGRAYAYIEADCLRLKIKELQQYGTA